MYSGGDIQKIHQCSSCKTEILKKEWKLLNCLHRICNGCVVRRRTDSGIKCVKCKSVTDDELFEFLNLTKSENCTNIKCDQEADYVCKICLRVYCKSCSVGHRRTNNEHQLCSNLFKVLPKYETVHCYDCKNRPAEVFCIESKCYRTYCAFCQLVRHEEHEFKPLMKLNEENRSALISVKNDIALNSVNIYDSMTFMDSHISKLEKDHKAKRAEMDKQWEMIIKEIMHSKNQTYNEFQKLYEQKVSKVKKNRSKITKLKRKIIYYSKFIQSIINHKNSAVDYKLLKIIMGKLQLLETQINNGVPKFISNKIPDFSMTKFIESSNKIINVISSVNNVAPPSIIVDLTNSDDEDKPLETVENRTLQIRTLPKKKSYTCDVCKRLFPRKSSIRRHMFTHVGLTSYRCDVCKIQFLQKCALKIHMVTHTKNEPFKCNICKKIFSYKCLLRKHQFTHTNKEPFKCDVCKKSFFQNYKLKNHMITHTDKQPYNCEVCKKLFSRKRNFYKHTLTSYRRDIVKNGYV